MNLQRALCKISDVMFARFYTILGSVLVLSGIYATGDELAKVMAMAFGMLIIAIDKNSIQTEALDKKKISKLLDDNE